MTDNDPWQPPDWRANAGRILLDPNGPNGEPLPTPLDRRWLWRLESSIAVGAPGGSVLAAVGRDLHAYLNETCEHHWSASEGDDDIPAHRQCLWCCTVDWAGTP